LRCERRSSKRDPPAELRENFWSNVPPIPSSGSRRFIIEQGDLATESQADGGLRKTKQDASLKFKVGRGLHREETRDQPAAKRLAALWPGRRGGRLRKVRYEFLEEDLCSSGYFIGRHAGIVSAEVGNSPNRASWPALPKAPWWFGTGIDRRKALRHVRLALT